MRSPNPSPVRGALAGALSSTRPGALAAALALAATLGSLHPSAARAAGAGQDWPRWRGPAMNGISTETGWSTAWPAAGPKQAWKASVGIGFASVAVAEGRVYTSGNQKDQDTIYAFDAATGKPLWQHSYACPLDPRYYEGGTSSTPTVDGDRVYTLSRKGHAFCFEAATGKVIWEKNLNDELGLKTFKEETPEWGYAGSPLIQGNHVIFNVGTAGAAFEKASGKAVWNTGKKLSGYATPVPFTVDGQAALAVFGAEAVHAVSLKEGKTLWSHPWKTSYDVNAADPIIDGNQMFISSGYGRGATLLKFTATGATKVWENKDLRNQFNSSVLLNGHLYGMDGNHGDRSSNLRCVEFATGKVKWTEKSVRPGGLMAAGSKLIAIGDTGELVVAEASPEGFKPLARAQVLGGKCWTTPVLSHGRIYCRNAKGDLVCLDVQGAAARR